MNPDHHPPFASGNAKPELGPLVGESAAMKMVFAAIDRIARTNAPALILGESGTGKELAARAIHRSGARSGEPFEVVDCSGLSDSFDDAELLGQGGAFGRAEGGTFYLDEIGDVPLELQSKVLRALGEQENRAGESEPVRNLDVRIIASSQRDLGREVKCGRFRADLYYRLAVIQLRMPPLRERLEDISLLARSLVPQIVGERAIDAQIELDDVLLAALSRHNWPGNVRELRNCLEQLIILRATPDLESEGAPSRHGDSASAVFSAEWALAARDGADVFDAVQSLPFRVAKAQIIEQFERRYIARLLEATGGNVAEAARRAGVDRVTLFRAMHRRNLPSHKG